MTKKNPQKHEKKIIMLGGSAPLSPAVRGGLQLLPPPGPGCLNSGLSPQFNWNAEYEIYHISKTTNRKYLKLSSVLVSEHFTSFETKNI